MPRFLILRLQGPMQGWSGHSFEGRRPLLEYPSRSGVLGLLAACLGICRSDRQGQRDLAESVHYAARRDARAHPAVAITDYHTVLDARETYQGLKSHDTIQTWRDYLCDAAFTVAVWQTGNGGFDLDTIGHAVRAPRYTPFLGRRSCPLTRPLFDSFVEAENSIAALSKITHTPTRCHDNGIERKITSLASTIYTEEHLEDCTYTEDVRDEPLGQARQFARRRVFVYEQEVSGVLE
ncbi:MAG: type I-E CRISPR-associated protein Cas5/CasD [Rhodocyclaceae bacterium]